MKIWIGFCLFWLMARVVSAGGFSSDLMREVKSVSPFNFSKVHAALEGITEHESEVVSDKQVGQFIGTIVNSYGTFEEFLRGPIKEHVLWVPSPAFQLSQGEMQVYNILAISELYPQTKTLFKISEKFRNLIHEQGEIVSRQERISAQRICFEVGDFLRSCVINRTVPEKVKEIVESSLEGAALNDENVTLISQSLMNLILKNRSLSIMEEGNFISDSVHAYLSNISVVETLISCASFPQLFYAFEMQRDLRCTRVLRDKIKSSLLEEDAKDKIVSSFMNPYGVFKSLSSSLVEEVLDRGIMCLTGDYYSCKRSRLEKRIDKWSKKSSFTVNQRERLINALSLFWSP